MTIDDVLAADADRNFIGSFGKLVEHRPDGSVRWFGGAFAFVSMIPITIFNGVVVARPTRPDELARAVEWIENHGVVFRAWIRERYADELAPALLARGLEREEWVQPDMVLRLPAEIPAPAPGVTVLEVEDIAGAEDPLRLLIASGIDEPTARTVFTPGFVSDPDVRVFVGRLDGKPVSHATAIRTGDVSGVYAVGTQLEARRRGVGTAATWAAVGAGRDWGCRSVFLQSSEMGYGVYRAMGFTDVTRSVMFRRLR